MLRRKLGLRNRKGAVLVITGVILVVLLMFTALAVDFSKIFEEKAQMQTAVDAAAMAGAIQLLQPDRENTIDSAMAYAAKNIAMNRAVVLNTSDVELGTWAPSTRTFTPVATVDDADAVRVTASRPGGYLIARIFDPSRPTITARAVAWASAPVGETDCIKPWALPFKQLKAKLGYTGSDLTSDLTPEDIRKLNNDLTQAERTDTLKFGSGGATDAPGNYYPVVLPPFWKSESQSYQDVDFGADTYSQNIIGDTCNGVGVGDSLWTEPGNKVGPTLSATDSLCTKEGGTITGDTCMGPDGVPGVTIKIAYWAIQPGSQLNGRRPVEVRIIGSFVLTDIIHKSQSDKATIIGYYKAIEANGSVSSVTTTLRKPILVQ